GAASTGAAMAALLLGVYSAAIAVNLVRGRRGIDCGCLGPAADQSISPALLGRNAILVAGALAAMLPAGHRSLHWVDSLTFVAGLATLSLLFIAANQLLATSTRHSYSGSPS
ncbi:MAG: methylamine utilization protein MauE, partial [Deltaproteobacteria bacterium]|nr:methylamine utilization protein MauE [Deltaproteobacteria bacterium]